VRVRNSQCMQNNLDVSFYTTVLYKFFVVVYLNNTVCISAFINVYQPLLCLYKQLWPVRASIWRCSFLPYVELYENFRFTERLVFQRKTVQLS
jgi:hypothetical protein